MFTYKAFNLIVHSDISLPGYTSVDLKDHEEETFESVYIRLQSISTDLLQKTQNDLNEFTGVASGLFKCRIQQGENIILDPDPDADLDFIQVLVGGMLMAALLRQRGLLVLHGSCVANEKGAIAFIGNTGWGKSTLANAFLQHGYSFVSDDLLVVGLHTNSANVLTGPASTKLWPDSGELFTENYTDLPKVHLNTVKRILSIDTKQVDKCNYSTTLQKIYILENIKREMNQVIPISRADAFLELTKHTRVNKWLTEEPLIKNHFNQCITLLKLVPVALLQRKKTLDSLSEIRDTIEVDLEENVYSFS